MPLQVRAMPNQNLSRKENTVLLKTKIFSEFLKI